MHPPLPFAVCIDAEYTSTFLNFGSAHTRIPRILPLRPIRERLRQVLHER